MTRLRRPHGICPPPTLVTPGRTSLTDRLCYVVLALGCLAAVLLVGCMSPGQKKPPATVEKAADEKPVEVAAPLASPERLTAIEDFLARTQHYRAAPPSPAALSTQLASAATAPVDRPAPARLPTLPPTIAAVPESHPAPQAIAANAQMDLREPAPAATVLPVIERLSIRGASSEKVIPVSPAADHAANMAMRASAERAETLEALIEQWRSAAAAHNGPDSHWRLHLGLLLAEREDEARDLPSTIQDQDRTLLSSLIEVATAIRDLLRDPAAPAKGHWGALEDLQSAMSLRSEPVIVSVALCGRVLTFGVFDEMAAEEFIAGRNIQTILYSEMKHLRSQINNDGQYETRLKTRVELLTGEGRSVWSREEPEIVDVCRTRRTDFFIAQRLSFPPTLPAGDYVLKVYVEDMLAKKVTESSRPVAIMSPATVAKAP